MNQPKTNKKQECRFCGYISGGNVTREIDIPWKECSDYAAFISQGAFIPGWTVVVPKQHAHNMSEHYGNPKLEAFIASVCSDLEKAFGKSAVLFEHGPTRNSSLVGCGTDHAHLHLVPLAKDLKTAVERFSPTFNWELVSMRTPLNFKDEYLLFAEQSNGVFSKAYIKEVESPTSQYFRQVLASFLGNINVYDYKMNPMYKEAKASLEKIKALELETID